MAGPGGARGRAKLIQPQARARAGLERLGTQIEGGLNTTPHPPILNTCSLPKAVAEATRGYLRVGLRAWSGAQAIWG